jgi:hypothetical protein
LSGFYLLFFSLPPFLFALFIFSLNGSKNIEGVERNALKSYEIGRLKDGCDRLVDVLIWLKVKSSVVLNHFWGMSLKHAYLESIDDCGDFFVQSTSLSVEIILFLKS